MFRTTGFFVALVVFGSMLFACKKDTATESSAVTAAAPAAVELTPALLKAAKGIAKGGGDFDEALNKLQAKLGKPTKVEGPDTHWAVVDGDKCHSLTLVKQGDRVAGVMGPNSIDKMMKSMFEKCAKRAK